MSSPTEPDPTASLLVRIAATDREALTALYKLHAGRMLGVLSQMLRDRAEAEDVLQDVFLQVWRKADAYDPARGRGISWLVVMTRRRGLDHIRRQKRYRARVEAAGESDMWTETLPPECGLDREELSGALASLPPDQREAISLAFLRGMSHSEVSDALGEPLGTIKARIRRGLARLRQILRDGEENQP